MRNYLNIFLFSLFIFHLIIMGQFELAHDEAYYWLYAKNLSWGYFDHPPFVGLVIKVFSFLPHTELSVRFGFLVLFFCTIMVLFQMVDEDKKLLSLKLFLAFPIVSSLGMFALPDLPLLFMGAIYLLFLRNYLSDQTPRNVILLSFGIALLLYAKYHGILLIFFTIFALPKLFKEKTFYFVFLLSLILFLPHLLWQYEHNFSTLRYHFLERPSSDFSIKRLFEYLAGQLFLNGLFVGPIIWYQVIKNKTKSDFEKVLKTICLGSIIFFFVSSFSKKFEANWTIFIALPLILLVYKERVWNSPSIKWCLNISVGIILCFKILLIMDPKIIPISRLYEFHGWKSFTSKVSEICQGPIVANTYQVASKISYYLNQPIHSVNLGSRKNQFDFWNFDSQLLGQKVCYITNQNDFAGEIIYTPESKKLIIVQNMDYNELLKIKVKTN